MPAPTPDMLHTLGDIRSCLVDYEQMAEMLREAQSRCTELLEENRRLKAGRDEAPVEIERLERFLDEEVPGGMCGDDVVALAVDVMRTLLAREGELAAECERLRAVVADAIGGLNCAVCFSGFDPDDCEALAAKLDAALAAHEKTSSTRPEAQEVDDASAQGLQQSSARCGGTEADSETRDNQDGDVADEKGRPSPGTDHA